MDNAALAAALDDFAATVTGEFSIEDLLRQLASAATKILDVDGAGVMGSRDGELLRFVFATAAPVEQVERLQQLLASGPCTDSSRSGVTINLADLAVEGAWPEYQRQAVELGLHAVTAIPLKARGRTWGVLDLYRRRPVRLDDEELAAAATLANLATSYIVVTADRDAARAAQAQLADRAMHDPLTRLPVRWVFLEQLEHALARLRRHPGQRLAVLFLDLDGLKYVNDTFGHRAGDALINACVDRIRATLRPSEVLARIGGDEFVVLLEEVDGAAAATAVAQRIVHSLAEPFRADGQVLQPSASIGIAVTSDALENADALISHADAAMYAAKQAGRGRYELFDPGRYAAGRAEWDTREELTSALRTGMGEGQLELWYQPIIELGPDGTGDETAPPWGVEALARWRHPRLGLLTAGSFIEAAEHGGLITDLGRWALRTALAQVASWDRRLNGAAPRRIFVNLSVSELTRPDLPRVVDEALTSCGIDPPRLTLEITETGLFSDHVAAADAMRHMHELRDLGCELAIDDFGTGYSSLSRLVQIPATVLKVDQSFTHGLHANHDSVAVVAAVLQLGHTLRRSVIVEGVEDARTLSLIAQLGGTYVQGFHLARPQPPDRVTSGLVG